MPPLAYDRLETPIGPLLLAGDGEFLRFVRFPPAAARVPSSWIRDRRQLARASAEIGDYFAGAPTAFGIPVAFSGNPFEEAVWRAIARIPYGATVSYGDIAREIGQPGSARAVGAAAGANPLPIVIPCHRVIGSDGSLTGFGGGLEIKAFLLSLERRVRPPAGRQLCLFD